MRKITLLGIVITILVYAIPFGASLVFQIFYEDVRNYEEVPLFIALDNFGFPILVVGTVFVCVFWFFWVVKKIGVK